MAWLAGALGGTGAGAAGAAGAADAAAAAGTAGLSTAGLGAGASLASGLSAFGPAAGAGGGFGGLLSQLGPMLGQFGGPTTVNAAGPLGFGQGLLRGYLGQGMQGIAPSGFNAPMIGNILGQVGAQAGSGGGGAMQLPTLQGGGPSKVLPTGTVQPGKDKLDVLGLGLNIFPGSPTHQATPSAIDPQAQQQLQRRMQLLQQMGIL